MTPPTFLYLPFPVISRSASEWGMEGSGGTTGAPRPRQLPAAAAAAAAAAVVAAAVLSVTRAAATVFTTVFGGLRWEAARAHFVQHDIPRCQRLQKVQPFIVGRGVRRRASRVFSPGSKRRRWIGRGLATGSPSLPATRPWPGVVWRSMPGGVPAVSGCVGYG